MNYLNQTVDNYKNMLINITKKLYEHPQSVCMDYKQHCMFSLTLAHLHLYGVFVSTTHAFFPWIYSTAATDLNEYMAKLIVENGCKKND